jgi:hypothetical protein
LFTESTFKSNRQDTASEIDESLATTRMPKRLNSQFDDSDFEPNSEDILEDFKIRETPVRRRRNTRKSPRPSPTKEGRILRKRVKR